MDELIDHHVLPPTADLCETSLPCPIHRPPERDAGPLDGVHFCVVFFLPSGHTGRFHLYGDTALMSCQTITLTLVLFLQASDLGQAHTYRMLRG